MYFICLKIRKSIDSKTQTQDMITKGQEDWYNSRYKNIIGVRNSNGWGKLCFWQLNLGIKKLQRIDKKGKDKLRVVKSRWKRSNINLTKRKTREWQRCNIWRDNGLELPPNNERYELLDSASSMYFTEDKEHVFCM